MSTNQEIGRMFSVSVDHDGIVSVSDSSEDKSNNAGMHKTKIIRVKNNLDLVKKNELQIMKKSASSSDSVADGSNNTGMQTVKIIKVKNNFNPVKKDQLQMMKKNSSAALENINMVKKWEETGIFQKSDPREKSWEDIKALQLFINKDPTLKLDLARIHGQRMMKTFENFGISRENVTISQWVFIGNSFYKPYKGTVEKQIQLRLEATKIEIARRLLILRKDAATEIESTLLGNIDKLEEVLKSINGLLLMSKDQFSKVLEIRKFNLSFMKTLDEFGLKTFDENIPMVMESMEKANITYFSSGRVPVTNLENKNNFVMGVDDQSKNEPKSSLKVEPKMKIPIAFSQLNRFAKKPLAKVLLKGATNSRKVVSFSNVLQEVKRRYVVEKAVLKNFERSKVPYVILNTVKKEQSDNFMSLKLFMHQATVSAVDGNPAFLGCVPLDFKIWCNVGVSFAPDTKQPTQVWFEFTLNNGEKEYIFAALPSTAKDISNLVSNKESFVLSNARIKSINDEYKKITGSKKGFCDMFYEINAYDKRNNSIRSTNFYQTNIENLGSESIPMNKSGITIQSLESMDQLWKTEEYKKSIKSKDKNFLQKPTYNPDTASSSKLTVSSSSTTSDEISKDERRMTINKTTLLLGKPDQSMGAAMLIESHVATQMKEKNTFTVDNLRNYKLAVKKETERFIMRATLDKGKSGKLLRANPASFYADQDVEFAELLERGKKLTKLTEPPKLPCPIEEMTAFKAQASLYHLICFSCSTTKPSFGVQNQQPTWWPNSKVKWEFLESLTHYRRPNFVFPSRARRDPIGTMEEQLSFFKLALNKGYESYNKNPKTYVKNIFVEEIEKKETEEIQYSESNLSFVCPVPNCGISHNFDQHGNLLAFLTTSHFKDYIQYDINLQQAKNGINDRRTCPYPYHPCGFVSLSQMELIKHYGNHHGVSYKILLSLAKHDKGSYEDIQKNLIKPKPITVGKAVECSVCKVTCDEQYLDIHQAFTHFESQLGNLIKLKQKEQNLDLIRCPWANCDYMALQAHESDLVRHYISHIPFTHGQEGGVSMASRLHQHIIDKVGHATSQVSNETNLIKSTDSNVSCSQELESGPQECELLDNIKQECEEMEIKIEFEEKIKIEVEDGKEPVNFPPASLAQQVESNDEIKIMSDDKEIDEILIKFFLTIPELDSALDKQKKQFFNFLTKDNNLQSYQSYQLVPLSILELLIIFLGQHCESVKLAFRVLKFLEDKDLHIDVKQGNLRKHIKLSNFKVVTDFKKVFWYVLEYKNYCKVINQNVKSCSSRDIILWMTLIMKSLNTHKDTPAKMLLAIKLISRLHQGIGLVNNRITIIPKNCAPSQYLKITQQWPLSTQRNGFTNKTKLLRPLIQDDQIIQFLFQILEDKNGEYSEVEVKSLPDVLNSSSKEKEIVKISLNEKKEEFWLRYLFCRCCGKDFESLEQLLKHQDEENKLEFSGSENVKHSEMGCKVCNICIRETGNSDPGTLMELHLISKAHIHNLYKARLGTLIQIRRWNSQIGQCDLCEWNGLLYSSDSEKGTKHHVKDERHQQYNQILDIYLEYCREKGIDPVVDQGRGNVMFFLVVLHSHTLTQNFTLEQGAELISRIHNPYNLWKKQNVTKLDEMVDGISKQPICYLFCYICNVAFKNPGQMKHHSFHDIGKTTASSFKCKKCNCMFNIFELSNHQNCTHRHTNLIQTKTNSNNIIMQHPSSYPDNHEPLIVSLEVLQFYSSSTNISRTPIGRPQKDDYKVQTIKVKKVVLPRKDNVPALQTGVISTNENQVEEEHSEVTIESEVKEELTEVKEEVVDIKEEPMEMDCNEPVESIFVDCDIKDEPSEIVVYNQESPSQSNKNPAQKRKQDFYNSAERDMESVDVIGQHQVLLKKRKSHSSDLKERVDVIDQHQILHKNLKSHSSDFKGLSYDADSAFSPLDPHHISKKVGKYKEIEPFIKKVDNYKPYQNCSSLQEKFCRECERERKYHSLEEKCLHLHHPRVVVFDPKGITKGQCPAGHARQTLQPQCEFLMPINEKKLLSIPNISYSKEWGGTVLSQWRNLLVSGEIPKTGNYRESKKCQAPGCSHVAGSPIAMLGHRLFASCRFYTNPDQSQSTSRNEILEDLEEFNKDDVIDDKTVFVTLESNLQ